MDGVVLDRLVDRPSVPSMSVVEEAACVSAFAELQREPRVDLCLQQRVSFARQPLLRGRSRFRTFVGFLKSDTVPSTAKRCGCSSGLIVGQLGLVVALQQVGRHVPPGDLGVVERERRVVDRAPDHLVRVREVVLVVAVRAAERRDGRDRVSAPARAARALLVVRARRRHVPQRDARERPDVDTDLHRRRAGQHVDGGPLASGLIWRRDPRPGRAVRALPPSRTPRRPARC